MCALFIVIMMSYDAVAIYSSPESFLACLLYNIGISLY